MAQTKFTANLTNLLVDIFHNPFAGKYRWALENCVFAVRLKIGIDAFLVVTETPNFTFFSFFCCAENQLRHSRTQSVSLKIAALFFCIQFFALFFQCTELHKNDIVVGLRAHFKCKVYVDDLFSKLCELSCMRVSCVCASDRMCTSNRRRRHLRWYVCDHCFNCVCSTYIYLQLVTDISIVWANVRTHVAR